MVQDDVAALNADFGKAVANQDVDELVGFYDSKARMLAPNAPMAQGPDAIRQVFQAYLDAGVRSLDLQSIDVQEEGSLIVDVGRYVLGIQPPGADPVQDQGKYVVVLRRQPDQSLKIVVDAFNSDEAPPAG